MSCSYIDYTNINIVVCYTPIIMKNFQATYTNSIIKVNYWPGFIDIFVSVLMIFVFISFLKIVLNIETIQLLIIEENQNHFNEVFQNEFLTEMKSEKVKIDSHDNMQQITFSSEVLFDSGGDQLSYNGKTLLSRLAAVFRKTFQIAQYKQIQVEGHTDDTPITGRLKKKFPSNWELSSQRAINVVRFFIDMTGNELPQEVYSATGYSYYRPVKPNTNEKNKALNRRIEIRIVYTSKDKNYER